MFTKYGADDRKFCVIAVGGSDAPLGCNARLKLDKEEEADPITGSRALTFPMRK